MVTHVVNNPVDVWYFIQGEFRYLLYRKAAWALSDAIKAVYHQRIKLAKECYDNGECVCCGCTTPSLFFADKGCARLKYQDICPGKPCYLPMKKMKMNARNRME